MPGFKGRAIIYPGLLIAGWIIGRSISLSAEPVSNRTDAEERQARQLAVGYPAAAADPASCPSAFPQLAFQAAGMQFAPNRSRGWERIRNAPGHVRTAGWVGPLQALHDTPNGLVHNDEGPRFPLASSGLPAAVEKEDAPAAAAIMLKPKRLQVYGYSFWRQGSIGPALAPNAQYGGSQYGVIATWDPVGSAGRGPALLLRGTGTPDGSQREIAVGARWQPDRQWPLSVSLERRFRANSPDSFAAYVAGGVDRVPLVGGLALDAYGQAGYSLGGRSSPFVDAHARLQHPVADPLGIPIRIGAGTWIGGQKGAFHGDVGPTVSADIDARFTKFTLQIDWRKRVVGNAEPADGVAVTVSTGF